MDIFERKGVANRMFLRRELLTLKMNDGNILEKNLLKFDKVLETMKIEHLNIEFVKGRLLDNDIKKKTNSESDNVSEIISQPYTMLNASDNRFG